MATRTAVAGAGGLPWKLIGAILGVITIGHVLSGKKVNPLDVAGAALSIASLLADQ